ncbi:MULTISPECIES: lipoate--protein ligase family protein [Thioclava]|uniref:lipoate--protein ligase family protein n=2 Tax=Paracoccaceae TaxID=31989 RepID=UPI00113255BB|nr:MULTISPECIES: lipoate--protein ligase family protein [Thioclava]MBC7147375.1 lipoate--protein ligase family protein [Thioclava marina]
MTMTAPDSPVRELALADALDWEAARLGDIAAGRCGAAALLWSCERALVAPASLSRQPGFKRACSRANDAGWPVHLRATGGDLVPQGPDIVNLSLLFRAPPGAAFGLEDAYRQLTSPICEALSDAGISARYGAVPGAFCDGRFNITIAGRKFAGTAQRWRPMADGNAVQSHALMLMRSLDGNTVATLNRFYHDCGIDRVIDAGAHVGLHDLLAKDTDARAQHRILRMIAVRAHASEAHAPAANTRVLSRHLG